MMPVLAILVVAAVLFGQTRTYVGAAKCEICHKSEKIGQQYPIWQASKHASSFAALSTPQAAANAQAFGIKDPANDPRCLKCHSPLAEKAPDLKAEGVSCEACHGPGSEYKKFSIMKDKTEAQKNGLILFADAAAIKTWCLTCHANAHNKPFDFAQAWDKIKHDIPKQN
jgi:cytochrome c peroxidase